MLQNLRVVGEELDDPEVSSLGAIGFFGLETRGVQVGEIE